MMIGTGLYGLGSVGGGVKGAWLKLPGGVIFSRFVSRNIAITT